MRTGRALWANWKASVASAAEFRTDAVVGLLVSTAWLAFAVAPAVVVFENVESAQGWTLSRLLFVSAVWYALDAMMWVLIFKNIVTWPDQVRLGELDAILLRPVDSLTMASLMRLNVADLPKIPIALVLAGATLLFGESVSFGAIVPAMVATVAAMVIFWAVAVLANVKVLTSVRFDGTFLLHTTHNLARIPTPLYGNAVRLLLTVAVPITFLTTVPAEVIYGASSRWMALASVAVAALLTVAARLAWRHQVRRYVGAMA